MIKLLVMCGTGVATSSVATVKVEQLLQEHGYDKDVEVVQGKLQNELKRLDDYDVIISTVPVPGVFEKEVINGTNIVTGINVYKTYNDILLHVKKSIDHKTE